MMFLVEGNGIISSGFFLFRFHQFIQWYLNSTFILFSIKSIEYLCCFIGFYSLYNRLSSAFFFFNSSTISSSLAKWDNSICKRIITFMHTIFSSKLLFFYCNIFKVVELLQYFYPLYIANQDKRGQKLSISYLA